MTHEQLILLHSDPEFQTRVKQSQEDSWEAGYFAGRDGEPRVVPLWVKWPAHWRIGYDAAVADKKKRGART